MENLEELNPFRCLSLSQQVGFEALDAPLEPSRFPPQQLNLRWVD
jgi:hypothetical protein